MEARKETIALAPVRHVLGPVGVAAGLVLFLPPATSPRSSAKGLGSLPAERALAFALTVLGATLLARPAGEDRVAHSAFPSPARPLGFD